MTSVLERDGIGAGIRIGQIGQFDLRPGRALVTGDGAEDLGVTGPPDRHEATVFQEQDTGLDRGGSTLPLLDRDFLPREPIIAATLEMDLPRRPDLQSFGTAARKDGAVLQLHGLVLDGPEDAFGQSASRTPSLTVVVAQTEQAPPFNGIRADLIVKLQRTFLGLEQDGIPTGETFTIGLGAFGDFHGSRPFAVHPPGRPNRDVGLALGLTGKPSGDQGAIPRLNDCRGMTARHGVRLEDEFGADQTRLGGESG